jgi:hypothetical protein
MRRVFLMVGAAALLAGCSDRSASPPTEPRLKAVFAVQPDAQNGDNGNGHNLFLTQISGDNEVPPRDTPGHGTAVVRLTENEAGDALDYVLEVSEINNVVASHIHLAPPGVNGGIVVFLYGNAPAGGGLHNGLLAKGTLTSANLIGTLAGKTIADLVKEIRAGNAYVNVHTNDGVAPTNTGAGDFPGGEIRGQLDVKGDK